MKIFYNKFRHGFKPILNKSFYLFGMLTIPFFGNAQSQEPSSSKNFQLGFTASPTFGWITAGSEAIKPNGLRTGFSYGVLADFAFSNNYYFSSGLTLSTINANTKSGQISSAYKIQYLEVPLTLKLKSNEIQNRKFYGQFGLDGAVKIGAKQGIDGQSDVEISKNVNLFRLGMIIGGGAEWRLGQNTSLLTGLSYNNGFTDILDGANKAKNSYLSLNFGVFF